MKSNESSRSARQFLTFDNRKILFKLNVCKTLGLESKQNTNEEVVKFLLIQQSQLLYLRNLPILHFLGQDAPNSFHYLAYNNYFRNNNKLQRKN